jgi:hypothetical protein
MAGSCENWKKITDMKMRLIQDALKATGRG